MRNLWTASAVLLALLTGCQAASPRVDNPLVIEAAAYDGMFDAAVIALRGERFVIDRQDYRFGQILTEPLVAATVLEPWHTGRNELDQTLASTLNYQRRVARITLTPGQKQDDTAAATADTYELTVIVNIEQIELPARRLSGSTRGARMFDELQSVPAELQARGIQGNYWSIIGRDEAMEQRLLKAIHQQPATVAVAAR